MRKEFGFNNNIIGIPKNGTTQNTINCSLVCQTVVTKNYCQYWITWQNQEGNTSLNNKRI